MIWHTPEGCELVKGMAMKKVLQFVPSKLLKSSTQNINYGNQLIFTIKIQKWGSQICLVFWGSEPQYAYKRYAYKTKHVLPGGYMLFQTATFGLLFKYHAR